MYLLEASNATATGWPLTFTERVEPSLIGVGLRNALFHDGCAKSVAERFGPCGGTAHGNPQLLTDDERADLITFLRSL